MPGKSFTLPSFAKINWLLRVHGKRKDGFHELCTVFQTVSLQDSLSFDENDELILTSNAQDLPVDERNLIVLAAKLLQQRIGGGNGARIHLTKNIPSPGGLGGGSSNAAVALLGLATLWRAKIGKAELLEIGNLIGSDVPFFFYGGTAVGTGRGNEIIQRKELRAKHMLIVSPRSDVPTPKAFDLLDRPYLTNKDSKSILQICRQEAETLNLRQSELVNDFEKVVFKIEPEIERVKKKLLELGARNAAMSGSGASVFAVFDRKERLQNAFEALKAESAWRTFVAGTVSRREYVRSLNPVKSLLH